MAVVLVVVDDDEVLVNVSCTRVNGRAEASEDSDGVLRWRCDHTISWMLVAIMMMYSRRRHKG